MMLVTSVWKLMVLCGFLYLQCLRRYRPLRGWMVDLLTARDHLDSSVDVLVEAEVPFSLLKCMLEDSAARLIHY